MERFFNLMIELIYNSHSQILTLNDAFEYNFTDKELHFLVIGVIGMLLIFTIYPVFKFLAKHGHIMTITWIYVTTLIVVLTFTIEIGQKAGRNGSMEFADILFGIVGFMAMYFIFVTIRAIVKGIFRFIRYLINRKKKTANNI